ncbi:DEAD/DEAH box helicase [uncultured Jatrophihabitans sp.]|uniref:DEAD/DEAH box helicase n=1 Tax=uncultured Jatrophihabitans sp. TaxID=1610747 RepID=UPI0035CAE17E
MPTERGAGAHDPDALLQRVLLGVPPDESPVTHVESLPARAAVPAPWPDWVPEPVRARFVVRGVSEPWAHQVEAANAAHAGTSVVVATGTASGKSLAYQLPALTMLAGDDRARVLYLSPTKALAQDQRGALTGLELPFLRAATFDGDTPMSERDWVRAHANWVLTNPDMLHRGILPAHGRWSSFLRRLAFVVIDECHTYRGLFGSHVAQVLRRLRRVCAAYGSTPTFVLASATVSAPARSASRLIGAPVAEVTADASPHGARSFVLWEPPLTALRGEHDAPVRRSAGVETARILADLVVEGARTLAFVRSRRGAELTALGAARHLGDAGATALVPRVAAYRAGYLPEERRAVEAALGSGELLGVAATNALELGVDISGLDAVVLAGYPGTLASLWQQAGRAGRSGAGALVVFVARDDPLDTYLVHHPAAVFGRPVEATVFDPQNPYVLAPQLCCAAVEAPIRPDELAAFSSTGDNGSDNGDGVTAVRAVLDDLVARGVLRRRPAGWFWTQHERPDVDIRGTGGRPVSVVESNTGNLIGTVDAGAADSTVHEGAVYLHRGTPFVVDALDLDERVALVRRDDPPWTTTARDVTDIAIVQTLTSRRHGPLEVAFGTVDVTHQVVGYLRRRLGTGELIDETPLDLPPRELRTSAVWYTLPQDLLDGAGLDMMSVPGAVHAAEHAAIGLLPLFATCDRWDIGGVSTALHPDTGRPTVFVYDGHPGGAGFAERGHAALASWLTATREAIAACECPSGCPSCVQSPKCGNGNEPLDKAGALIVLDLVLAELPG